MNGVYTVWKSNAFGDSQKLPNRLAGLSQVKRSCEGIIDYHKKKKEERLIERPSLSKRLLLRLD